MAFQLDAESLQKSFDINKPCVYWIKHKSHTDFLTQGYIGIAKKIRTRLSQHSSNLRNKGSQSSGMNIYKAAEKHGVENLEVKIILFAEWEYCKEMEEIFRPRMYIGWNVSRGGICPPYRTTVRKPTRRAGYKPSDETKSRQSAAAKRRYLCSDHPRLGAKLTEEQKIKMSAAKSGVKLWVHPWCVPVAAKHLWVRADEIYLKWFASKLKYVRLGNELGLGRNGTIYKMVKMFVGGWVPAQDTAWVQFKEGFKHEV